jgi:aspartate-semialdehyde dehydrogenase
LPGLHLPPFSWEVAMKYDVCVVGPRTLLGETLLEILEERAFPVGALHLLDSGEEVGETVTFAGRDHTVREVADFDFAAAPLVFFCGGPAQTLEHVPRANRAGCRIIDASGALAEDPEVPLVVPEVNPDALHQGRLFASPSAAAVLAAATLKPLVDPFGLTAVRLVSLEPVSGTGRAAVEELARQSMALFNQTAVQAEVYPKQIAFNLLPQIGAPDDSGYSSAERTLIAQLKRLLGLPGVSLEATCVRVPVFFGQALVVQADTQRPVSREAVQRLFDVAPGVVLYDRPEAGGWPTPVMEAATNDPIFIGRVRASAENAKGISFWAVVDNMRKGGALNCVQIAEKLIGNSR